MNFSKFLVFLFFCIYSSLGFSESFTLQEQSRKIKNGLAANDATLKVAATTSVTAKTAVAECVAAVESTEGICNTTTSPVILKGTATVGLALGAISLANGMSNACSKFSSVTKVASGVLAAFNAACGFSLKSCTKVCGKATASLATAHLEAAKLGVAGAGEALNIENAQKSLKILVESCPSYKLNLTAAGVGIGGLLASSLIGQKCTKETNNSKCAQSPDLPECKNQQVTALNLDCSKVENQNTPSCICRMNPRAPGCSGFKGADFNTGYSRLVPANRNSGNQNSSSGGGSFISGSDGEGAKDQSGGADGGSFEDSGSSSAANAPGGGSGSFSSSSADGAGVQKTGKSDELNADILEGYEGGGGGGGSRGRSVSSSGGISAGAFNAYGSFLPGEENDRAKLDATEIPVQDQVTGGGGVSNFEKVQNQYFNQSSSLIGQ